MMLRMRMKMKMWMLKENRIVRGKTKDPLWITQKVLWGEYPKEQGSNNGTNSPNGKTDISFVGRQGTANDRTARETENGTANDTSRTRLVNPKRQSLKPKDTENERGRGTGMPKSAESLPKETTSQTNSWGSDIISSTCVETFKARVEYAKSLGIEEGVAVRICNLAQSESFRYAKCITKDL